MQAFVPKNRKPKFDLVLKIIDLTNIPLVSGTTYVKWYLPSSLSAESRGRTDKAVIRDHKAIWDYRKELAVRMTIEKTQQLQECAIEFEILQEYQEIRGGRVQLGNVKLNLAEYTQLLEHTESETSINGEDEDGSITRRYLLQDSKINSTLKIGIKLTQTEGDTNYIAPPLKSAMVAGGIARIVNADAMDGDDIPSISNKTRELAEAQDIYRRTLAATWACHTGELPPDRLIEDLFAGGDGDAHVPPPIFTSSMFHTRDNSRGQLHEHDPHESTPDDTDPRHTEAPKFLNPDMARSRRRTESNDSPSPFSGGTSPHSSPIPSPHAQHHSPHSTNNSAVSGRGSIEQQTQHSHHHSHSHHSPNHQSHGRHRLIHHSHREPDYEFTEFDLRDDLRSWSVSVK